MAGSLCSWVASHLGIGESRAVNFNCDSVGTALNYEVIGEAIGTLRKCNFVNENWKERIDEDFHKRSKSHNK